MKLILQKTQTLILLLFCAMFVFGQQKMKVPADAVFYMEINGKQLNKKINWQKFNPILQEVAKKSNEKPSWTDYSKTGIKYDATQYHYASFNDSTQIYTAHFILDNKEKFQEFINSTKKKGLEISKKKNYSYVDIEDDLFVAWNGERAVLSMINYNKPSKDIWEDLDSTEVAVVDSAAVVVDSAKVAEEEEPFDYKEEIEYLKEDIQYMRESIRQNTTEIAKKQKDIKYLEKNHKYPKEDKGTTDEKYSDGSTEIFPPKDEYDEDDMMIVEEDSAYQKKLDSIKIENFKMVKKIAEQRFDMYFNSSLELEPAKEMLNFRDANADVFVYTDYGKIVSDGVYGRMMKQFEFGRFFNKIYNSNSAYNLYFDNDKVKLVNSYQHKDPEVQKVFSAVYKGKKNKKLSALINDKSIGYYVINVDGSKYFDVIYSMFKNSGEEEYQKEMELMVETMKIVLDEKAISKVAPGNGIFVLNELKSKTVEYTDYEYDDDYNEKEIKKTKEVMVPDFTFAFATENEGYWNRFFNALASNKKTAEKISKNGDFYSFKDNESKDGYLDQMYFTVKDGIVYLVTSPENLTAKNQSEISKQWAKDSSKYPMSGRLNTQKLMIGMEKEFNSASERKIMNVFKKNAGEMYFKTEAKGERIETEMNYNIKNSSENSLMYFFDLFDEILKITEAEKKPKIL